MLKLIAGPPGGDADAADKDADSSSKRGASDLDSPTKSKKQKTK